MQEAQGSEKWKQVQVLPQPHPSNVLNDRLFRSEKPASFSSEMGRHCIKFIVRIDEAGPVEGASPTGRIQTKGLSQGVREPVSCLH